MPERIVVGSSSVIRGTRHDRTIENPHLDTVSGLPSSLYAIDKWLGARRLPETAKIPSNHPQAQLHQVTLLQENTKREDNNVAVDLQTQGVPPPGPQPPQPQLKALRLEDAKLLDPGQHDAAFDKQSIHEDFHLELEDSDSDGTKRDTASEHAQLKAYNNILQIRRWINGTSPFGRDDFFRARTPSMSEIVEGHDHPSDASVSDVSEPLTPSAESYKAAHGGTYLPGVGGWLLGQASPWVEGPKHLGTSPNHLVLCDCEGDQAMGCMCCEF